MAQAPKGRQDPPGTPLVGETSRRGHIGRRARHYPKLAGGAYLLDRRLFQDPLGTVWDAVVGATGARVAIRVFEGPVIGTQDARRILRSRLRATPQIRHPNVALVFNHDVKEKGYAFVTMEELRGETLSQRLARDGRVPLEEATEMGAALARGLAAAHERGVTHGGIAPEMVFITSGGPKLLGLGIGDLGHGYAGSSGDAAADDVLGLMRLVKTITASPVVGANGEGSSPKVLIGGAVGQEALSNDPAARPSAQELAAALAEGPEVLAEPAEASYPVAADLSREEKEQADRAAREQADRERVELEMVKRAQREEAAQREERERGARAEREASEREEQASREAVEKTDLEPAEPEAVEQEEGERAERAGAEPAVSVMRRAIVATAVIIVVAAIGIGARELSGSQADPSSPASPSIGSLSPAIIPATVPDVLGRTIRIAENRIVAAKLEVGDIIPIAGRSGRVVRTDPTPGEAVTAGTPVTIYVGNTVP
jgi:hypothetical protein